MDEDVDEYVKLKSKQLEIAHVSNVLVFSRDKTTQTIAKKLKTEFSRVFFSSDTRECQKMLANFNNLNLNAVPVHLVSIIHHLCLFLMA